MIKGMLSLFLRDGNLSKTDSCASHECKVLLNVCVLTVLLNICAVEATAPSTLHPHPLLIIFFFKACLTGITFSHKMQSQLQISVINFGYCFKTKEDCLQHTVQMFACTEKSWKNDCRFCPSVWF